MRFFEKLDRTTLSNGFTIITDYLPAAERTHARIIVGSGGHQDPLAKQGTAHALEHMWAYSHPAMTKIEFFEFLDQWGLRGRSNFYSSGNSTMGFCDATTPRTLHWLDNVADMVVTRGFEPDHLDEEREPLIEEVTDILSDPETIQKLKTLQGMYGEQRLALPTCGTPEHMADLSWNDLQNFGNDHYVGSNMFFVTSGGISHDAAVEFASGRFGFLPKGQRSTAITARFLPSEVRMPIPEKRNKSTKVTVFFDASAVMPHGQRQVNFLSGYLNTALFHNVRLEKNTLYSISAHSGHCDAHHGFLSISFSCAPQKVDNVLRVIAQCIDKSLHDPVAFAKHKIGRLAAAEETFADAKNSFGERADFLTSSILDYGRIADPYERVASTRNFELADARNLMHAIVVNGPPTVVYEGHIEPSYPTGAQIREMLGYRANAIVLVPQPRRTALVLA